MLQRPPPSGRGSIRIVRRRCHADREPGPGLGGGGNCRGGGKATGKQAIAHVFVRRRGVVSLQPDQEVGDLDRRHGPHFQLQRDGKSTEEARM